MAKYTDCQSRLKAVYFFEKKSDALHTLGRFIQDLAIPLGLRVQHLRLIMGASTQKLSGIT